MGRLSSLLRKGKPYRHVVYSSGNPPPPPNKEFFHLFVQVATRRVMEGAVIIVFPHHGTNPEQMDSGPALKADDEQAVRYVAP